MRSDSATARSGSRPLTTQPSPARSIAKPSRTGRSTTKPSVRRPLGARREHQRREPAGELPQPLSGDGGDAGAVEPHALVVGSDEVGARPDEQPGPFEQVGLVPAQLGQQHPLLLRRSDAARGGPCEVDQHAQDAGPLDMAEELVAEALALAGPLDQARDVGDDEFGAGVEPHDAEVGLEGGERVVGDLGLGRGDGGDQRRLADVREPHEGHIGDQLQLEPQPALLAHLALLGERRRPAPVRQEPGVAPPASAAGRGHPAVAFVHEVGEHLPARAPHHGALGNRNDQVAARRAVALLAHAVGAVGRPPMRVVLEAEQRSDVAVGHQPDVATLAAVAAVGPALGDVRLAPERNRARAAVTTLDVQPTLVDETGHDG